MEGEEAEQGEEDKEDEDDDSDEEDNDNPAEDEDADEEVAGGIWLLLAPSPRSRITAERCRFDERWRLTCCGDCFRGRVRLDDMFADSLMASIPSSPHSTALICAKRRTFMNLACHKSMYTAKERINRKTKFKGHCIHNKL